MSFLWLKVLRLFLCGVGIGEKNVALRETHSFFCRGCCQNSAYVHMVLRRYFYFLWIPVWRLSETPNGAECVVCHDWFSDDACGLYEAEVRGEIKEWQCPHCHRKQSAMNVRCPICKVRPDGTPA